MQANPLGLLYLSAKLLDRYLDVAGSAHDLELADMKVLLYLRDCGTCGPMKEIAAYAGVTQSQAARALGHLKSRGFIGTSTGKDKDADQGADSERKTQDIEILAPAAPVLASIATALNDFDHARLAHLDEGTDKDVEAAETKEYEALVESFS